MNTLPDDIYHWFRLKSFVRSTLGLKYGGAGGHLFQVEIPERAIGHWALLGLLDRLIELLVHQVIFIFMVVDGLGKDGVTARVGFAEGFGIIGKVLEHALAGRWGMSD